MCETKRYNRSYKRWSFIGAEKKPLKKKEIEKKKKRKMKGKLTVRGGRGRTNNRSAQRPEGI